MPQAESYGTRRNIAAFWLLGLCNNFAYVIMLSAAKDILETGHADNSTAPADEPCPADIHQVPCSRLSTGSVLLADILPTLLIKIIAPFTLQSVPYSIRHFIVVLCQFSSFIIVAYSNSLGLALAGVCFASLGAGLGELTYLSLASHFPRSVVSGWSSGTGAAGVLGALIYAVLTERAFLSLSPSTALLVMLVVPNIFALTYWYMLRSPPQVHRVIIWRPETYWIRRPITRRASDSMSAASSTEELRRPLIDNSIEESSPRIVEEYDSMSVSSSRRSSGAHPHITFAERLSLIKPLIKFMIPLFLVYFGEYFINQGMVELVVFDCAHGFSLNRASQYRWYQVTYQVGVFISRSSIKFLTIRAVFLPFIAILQLLNAILFFQDALFDFLPHIAIVLLLIFYEGLLGGSAYVNAFSAVHKSVHSSAREFSMAFVSLADSMGIVLAGFVAIPAHNYICNVKR